VNLRACGRGAARGEAIAEAVAELTAGRLVVLPTDTVYGVAAVASNPAAVAALLAAKGRGRNLPPPVLMADAAELEGLAAEPGPEARALAEAFWPGALTLVVRSNPALRWDLGDRDGTIALRVPDAEVARAVLGEAGPLAVSSANLSGEPPALTAQAAADQLGANVAVYLDAGPAPGGVPSTVVDATVSPPRVLRRGALGLADLAAVVPGLTDAGGPPNAKNAPPSVPPPSVPPPSAQLSSAQPPSVSPRPLAPPPPAPPGDGR
jgi:tRNA threonylcarbamoyl adenosine modification protein (Sua5/YciO/YrdC/YwlC family)